MDRFALDLRIALRGFRRTPAFTVAAVLILGVGIGMSAAMATIFDAVLLQKLPVQEQDRIVVLWTYRDPAVEFGVVTGDLESLNRSSRTMRAVAGVAHWGAAAAPLMDGDRPIVLNRSLVTGNFFELLGARPLVGRFLAPADEAVGAAPVLVLSYAAWQEQFGADSGVIGHRLMEPYSQTAYSIVGVAPPGLDYPTGAGYWMPAWPGGNLSIMAVARLTPNATPESARAEFLSIMKRLPPPGRQLVGAKVVTFTEAVLGNVRPVLAVLTGAVTLLLLIACLNVGNLLLLRAATRTRELAIRRALGASAGDVLRQLLVESGLLAVAGGVLGLLSAVALLRGLLTLAPVELPRSDMIRLAGTPLEMAVATTFLAVLLFGVLPAFAAVRGHIASPHRLDSRSGTTTVQRRRVRHALVASQVALALIMLAGAGLLARSLERLERLDLGYNTERLSILQFSFGRNFQGMPSLFALCDRLAPRLRAVPGVTTLTPILIPPFVGANVFQGQLEIEGAPSEAGSKPLATLEVGGAEYFRTFEIPVRSGRGFLDTDREAVPQVAVVSEAIARRFWPNESPIGRRIRFWGPDTLTWRTVVGVAGDIHFRSLRESTPTIYLPWRQSYWQGEFAIRTSGDLATVLPALRSVAKETDPQLSLWSARTMNSHLASPLAQPRMSATLLSGFGLVALLLAAIGLYGLMASLVREQTREIGVRIALGATPKRLRREVLKQAMGIAGLGAIAGLVGALATSRLLAHLLFQVSPSDPITLVGACAVLLSVALVAAYQPARRATEINALEALRAD